MLKKLVKVKPRVVEKRL